MADFADARRIALALPGTAEGLSWGTPAFYVRKKFFARLLEDGERLALKCSFEERATLAAEYPEVFGWTPHYDKFPMVLVTLAPASEAVLREVVTEAWRMAAPNPLLKAYDAQDSEES